VCSKYVHLDGLILPSLPKAYNALDILSHLQNPSIISSVHVLDVIPNFDTMDHLAHSNDKEGRQHDSARSSYKIQDAATGLWHVTNVLSMLVDICMESATSHYATPAFQDYLAWLLDSFFIARGLQRRWQANPVFSEPCKRSEAMSFCAIQALLSALHGSLTETILRKGCGLLSILVVDLLQNSSSLSEKAMSYSICNSLLTLAAVCKRYESTRRSLALHLAPSIRVALDDDNAILALGTDFQARTHEPP
jgi:serine/threonine-protein kinase ATR